MSKRTLLAALLVAATAVAGLLAPAAPAHAILAPDELRCRATLARQSRRYLEHVHRVRHRCLRKIYTGKISPLTDCIGETSEGMGDERTAHRIRASRDELGATLPRSCIGADLMLLGFPGPCTPQPGSAFDVSDLEQCVISELDEQIAKMLLVESPPITFLPPNVLTCVTGVSRHGAAMVRKEVRARERCLLQVDKGSVFDEELTCREELPPYGRGTGSEDIDRKILGGYIDLLAGVPSICKTTNVNKLGWIDDCEDHTGGRFTSFDLKLCIFDSHRSSATEIVGCAFPAPPECGNGRVEADEECDDGNTNQNDGCLNDCKIAKCGDGFVRTGVEECDDGNAVPNDTCLNDCKVARCGDSVACTAAECTSGPGGGPEQCDDGNTNQNDPCLSTCKRAECGDGILCTALTPRCTSGPEAGPEVCDDGNKTSGDGCDSGCGQEFCGDGITQAGLGEQCDNGSGNSNTEPDACRVNCKLARCGDTVVDSGEACDPPNGTTCGPDCTRTNCGDGDVDAGEECDNGSANSDTLPDACRTTCRLPFCGDGVQDPGKSEECDDANSVNEDACVSGCKANVCGDGFRNPAAEQCDDGNQSNTDACTNACNNAICGDGFVRSGVEECDDGNTVSTDRCQGNCKLSTCGDGVTCSAANCTSGPAAGPEECDAGAGNSDTAPNTCRTNCASPRCGDDVKDTGEQCDGSTTGCSAGDVCADGCTCVNECPGSGELIVLAKDGRSCTTDEQCLAGDCILGRCRTESRLDTGMTGIAHGGDVTDGVLTRGFVECGGTFPCGVCEVTGLDASTGTCRCANDNRQICDQPFVADADHCGGQICNCYFGPPLAFSAGNTPACVVNRFAEDVSGTANVDLGAGEITAKLRSVVYTGEGGLHIPCPYCEGDDVENDGVRNGTCVFGPNGGLPCDTNAVNTTFPGPTGGGHSLDCFPTLGKNVSGAGLRIELTQKTGHSELAISGDVVCGLPPFSTVPCWCAQCTGDTSVSCTSNEECAALGIGECTSFGGADRPVKINACSGECLPTDASGILGECDEAGPDDRFCDAYLRASGEGYVACLSNGDCLEETIGIPAGVCTLSKRRPCFLDPIMADGRAHPSTPLGAATFCIPPTGSGAINSVAGIPGPGRVFTQARSKLFCAKDPGKVYVPGVGGCE